MPKIDDTASTYSIFPFAISADVCISQVLVFPLAAERAILCLLIYSNG